MSGKVPQPKEGDIVLIHRPGAPDRRMMVTKSPGHDPQPPPEPGWAYLFGYEVTEDGTETNGWPLTLYARYIGEGDEHAASQWEMVPYIPMDEPGPELAAKNARILKERLG